ncbi:MAG: hypothetical protein LWW96_11685 [Acidovorax sp.]|uniref:hypothetical protein n=1 Tax=Acidovorax sp. TaxID=1872122 RepID=UPI0025C19D55|nr:hypothetical protein [Acidovorax sp.]MCE1192802.1 hypothetical protein [Acidovorax sp.]
MQKAKNSAEYRCCGARWLGSGIANYFQNQNSQFATQWFFSEHLRRTVHPIDEPNPQGDSPNPVQEWFLHRLF